MAIRCPNCGNENPDDYAYCDECGARLTTGAGDPAAAGGGGGSAPTATSAGPAPDGMTGAPVAVPAMPVGGEMGGTSSGSSGGPTGDAPAAGSSSASPIRCPHCGTENMPGAAFCDECGAALNGPEVAQPAAAATPGMPPMETVADAPLSHPMSTPDATHAGSEPFGEPSPAMGDSSMGMPDTSMAAPPAPSEITDTPAPVVPTPATEDTIPSTPVDMSPPTASVPPPPRPPRCRSPGHPPRRKVRRSSTARRAVRN